MSRELKISKDLSLPLDAVTSTTIVYGGKGMGKTNFATVLCEELAAARQRFSVIDPMGVFWGLRHSADGKGAGIEVVILGGKHGDFPLEPTGGAVAADFVADEDANVILDISRHPSGKMWSIGERIRFVADYTTRLYERQGERRRPILQIIDEAARFVPQQIPHGALDIARCSAAVSTMTEEGRNVGIGLCLITQRSARMSKAVSEVADCMIAFRIVGPLSIAAVLDWFGDHVDKEKWKELIERLRRLPRGTALVVSPGWLDFEGEAAIRMRETFDSSATPKPGQEVKASGKGAKPNLEQYAERMKATIEKAKENDPAELRKQLRTALETIKKLESKPPAKTAAPQVDAAAIGKAVDEAVREAREPLLRNLLRYKKSAGDAVRALTEVQKHILGMSAFDPESLPAAVTSRPAAIETPRLPSVPIPATVKSNGHSTGVRVPVVAGDLSRVEQNILNQLADLEALGISRPEKATLAVLSGYTNFRSGGFSEPIAKLLQAGLLIYPESGFVSITAEGRSKAQASDKPLSSEELHERLCRKLGGVEEKILRELIAIYPQQINKDELGLKLGYQNPRSGGFSEPIGKLRTLGLAEYPTKGQVKAADLLFID